MTSIESAVIPVSCVIPVKTGISLSQGDSRFRGNDIFFASLLIISTLLTACAGGGGSKTAKTTHTAGISRDGNAYFNALAADLLEIEENNEGSLEFLKLALQKDKNSSALWAQKAYLDAKTGRWDDATASANAALKRDPDNIDALLLSGKLLAMKQNPAGAIPLYKRALAADPKNEEAYGVLARDLLAAGKRAEALQTLDRCRSELPEASSCLYYQSSIHLEAGELDEALSALKTLSDLNPEQGKLLQTVGEVALKKGDVNTALEAFRRLAQMQPNDLASQMRVGFLYYQLRRLPEALTELEAIAQRFPGSSRINYVIGLIYGESGETQKALDHLALVDNKSEYFPDALGKQLALLRDLGKFDEALKVVDEASHHIKSADILGAKAALLSLSSKDSEALTTLTDALKIDPNNIKILFQKAGVLDRMGQWEQAKEILRAIIAKDPASAEAYNFLGYSMTQKGENLDEALKLLTKANELKPDSGHIVDSLAWTLFKSGAPEKALPLLRKAIALEPQEPEIWAHLGEVSAALKDKRTARHAYEKALSILRAVTTTTPDSTRLLKDVQDKLANL